MLLDMVMLGIVAFVQNMSFTWTSLSRNSGDPKYHRYAAMCSNGIWLLCQLFIWKQIWSVFNGDSAWWRLMVAGIIYIVATTEGSVLMMRILLKREKGRRQVGARKE